MMRFHKSKYSLEKIPVLSLQDLSKEFILDTDTYASHAMNVHERGYCIARKDL